ncbi:MAG: hypothetical protein Q8O76_01635, partial [Chloroflexota bacterium]|nr:hypothetical protein [Chloroflexota bacterium]
DLSFPRKRESSLPETDAELLTLDSGSGAGMTFSYFVVLAASQNDEFPRKCAHCDSPENNSQTSLTVIPAQAGIQRRGWDEVWILAFARMTGRATSIIFTFRGVSGNRHDGPYR